MPKWNWRGDDYAPIGRLQVVFKDGYTIDARIQDCDGDFATCEIIAAGMTIYNNDCVDNDKTDNNGPIYHAIDRAQKIVEDFVCRSILPVSTK